MANQQKVLKKEKDVEIEKDVEQKVDKEELRKDISTISDAILDDEKVEDIEDSQKESKQTSNDNKKQDNRIVIDSKAKLKIILFTILTLGLFYILLHKEIKKRKSTSNKSTNIRKDNKDQDNKKDLKEDKDDINKKDDTDDDSKNDDVDLDKYQEEPSDEESKDDIIETIEVEETIIVEEDDKPEEKSLDEDTKDDEVKIIDVQETIVVNDKKEQNDHKDNKKLTSKQDDKQDNKIDVKDDKKSQPTKESKQDTNKTQKIDDSNKNRSLDKPNEITKKEKPIDSKTIAKQDEKPKQDDHKETAKVVVDKKIDKTKEVQTKSSDEVLSIKNASALRSSKKIPIDVDELIKCFGGISNITNVENSLSTIQFFVKDKSIVNKDGIKTIMNGKGISVMGQKFSIVCGDFASALKEEVSKMIKDN